MNKERKKRVILLIRFFSCNSEVTLENIRLMPLTDMCTLVVAGDVSTLIPMGDMASPIDQT